MGHPGTGQNPPNNVTRYLLGNENDHPLELSFSRTNILCSPDYQGLTHRPTQPPYMEDDGSGMNFVISGKPLSVTCHETGESSGSGELFGSILFSPSELPQGFKRQPCSAHAILLLSCSRFLKHDQRLIPLSLPQVVSILVWLKIEGELVKSIRVGQGARPLSMKQKITWWIWITYVYRGLFLVSLCLFLHVIYIYM